MRVWTTKDFKGHWPMGAAGVVVACCEEHARQQFDMALAVDGLDPSDGYELVEIDLGVPGALILVNGEY